MAKVLIKRRDGQYDWVSETEAQKLTKTRVAQLCDPKTFKPLAKQPEPESEPKKRGKKKK